MRVEPTSLPGVARIILDRFRDARGLFVETWDARAFAALGVATTFVQDSLARSAVVGTVRGMHFQSPPHAQHKLVRVQRGRIWDVVVDLRDGAPTFGRHAAFELDAEDWCQVLIPAGYAHGYCTLTPDVEVVYKMSDHFSPQCYGGMRWDDPALGIAWPVTDAAATISDKDRALPPLSAMRGVFPYATFSDETLPWRAP